MRLIGLTVLFSTPQTQQSHSDKQITFTINFMFALKIASRLSLSEVKHLIIHNHFKFE